MRRLRRALELAQAVLALRVLWRLARTGAEPSIAAVPPDPSARGSVAVIVPVLNEATRVAACLDALLASREEVVEIIVADGGSRDSTPEVVSTYLGRDPRLRWVAAGAAPSGWNGKVWGLAAGERALESSAPWLLTIDADVRIAPALARSLVARADSRGLRMLSVATHQQLSGPPEGLLHPALLATLVYRFGRPNGATEAPGSVLANGQCCLIRRDLLWQLGGFACVRDSLCEDVTLARLAARSGDRVGFYETDGLVRTAMYADWRDAWDNWPRSLATRDALFGLSGWLGIFEVLLVQALPLPLVLLGLGSRLDLFLLAVRAGMLAGMARAYPERPITYWLSPMLDVPVGIKLWMSTLSRRHAWRGRIYSSQKGVLVSP